MGRAVKPNSVAVRCSAGRNHRVRETLYQGDNIYVERCRCGAERVRDAGPTSDVSDWHHSLLSAEGSSSSS